MKQLNKTRGSTNLGITLSAHGPLAQLAPLAPGAEQAEARLQAQEAHLALLHVLLDVSLDGEGLQLGLGQHGADVHDLLQSQREPVVQGHRLLPLLLSYGSIRTVR